MKAQEEDVRRGAQEVKTPAKSRPLENRGDEESEVSERRNQCIPGSADISKSEH